MKRWLENAAHQKSVLFRLIGMIAKASPLYLVYEVLDAVLRAGMPFFFILVPKEIINEMLGARRIPVLLSWLLFMALGYSAAALAQRWVSARKGPFASKARDVIMEKLDERLLVMDYASCVDPEVIRHKMRALRPIRNQGAIGEFVVSLFGSLQNLLALAGVTGILFTLNPILVALLLAMVWIHARLMGKMETCEEEYETEMAIIDRRYDYYDHLASEEKRAKDVRLYQMRPFLMDQIREDNTNVLGKYFNQMYRKKGFYAAWAEAVSCFQTAAVYGWMIVSVFWGNITIGAMTMYLTSASRFTQSVTDLAASWLELLKNSGYLEQFLTFVDAGQPASGGKTERKAPAQTDSIAFEHVWFRYPGTEPYVLKDVTFRVSAAEKISIVGENGSGKTTMIKLLCRFYQPERGRILLNGIPIDEWDMDSYRTQISAVFQDFALFAFTLRQNLTFDRPGDEAGLRELIGTAGLDHVVELLPNGLDTHLFKNFEEDGVNLSGGEQQKLALARSIWQGKLSDSSILILDEPSSALDPYAEAELYETFGEMAKGKMTFFISHRLSSCRFCDRVLVMKEGRLAEEGSHQALLAEGGFYAEMWNAQAQFYQGVV